MLPGVESEWVGLTARFTPGWPWPEESYGLDPMFGADGWCHSCGTALRPQSGPVVIQGRKFPDSNVWTPNWLFDVVCVSQEVAQELPERFSVELGEVHKPREGASGAMQILPTVTIKEWYDQTTLSVAVNARHRQYEGDRTGSACPACNRWKWLPVGEGEAPVRASALVTGADVIASPEWFGDGLSAFRHLLFRRPLGEFLVAANPRGWSIVEIAFTAD